LKALLNTVSALDYKRVILAFQPHLFSRTKALFADFVAQLVRADVLYLAEIYAARERNNHGVTSDVLAQAVPGARCFPDFTSLTAEIAAIARDGDIIVTVGAGDIYKVGEELLRM